MTLFGFNVVDDLAPLPVVDVITVGVLCAGDDDLTLFVGDGALFACPFLAVTIGFNGRRGVNLSRVVESTSSSSKQRKQKGYCIKFKQM